VERGKLGVSTATHHFARLAVGPWGEEKTTQFVKAITEQKLVLGRLSELYNRLLLGEISMAVTLTDSNINEAKKTGAPVVFAEDIQPVISRETLLRRFSPSPLVLGLRKWDSM
jgi:hypothetical protein